jgi:peptidylprolyl isomerase
MTDQTAKSGDRVQVHYTGTLGNGEVFDTSRDGDPLEFELGSNQVITGFEQGVTGMRIGETKIIEIEPADAYGERVDALVQQVPRSGINLETEPQAGMNLVLQLADGNQIPVRLTEVTDEFVTLDANHPLAGERLIFDVELVAVHAA